MAMGSALTSGYNAARQDDRQRSFMPVINTLGQMIAANRRRGARGSSRMAGNLNTRSDQAAADRQARRDQEELLKKQEAQAMMDQNEADRIQGEKEELIQAEEARRQETHEQGIERSRMEGEQAEKKAGMDEKTRIRTEAYEQAKQGLMTRNAALIEEGLKNMMPEQEGKDADVITYGKTETGERKITARPREQEVPKFTFHPDGYVGVTFPGQEKPTIFQNEEEAFKAVVGPMNPQRWQGKGGTKDQVTQQKNLMEADYKERKLQADVHEKAHEAAMGQFEADGYYQPALYDEAAYERVYNDYVQKATGTVPKASPKPSPAPGGPPKQYSGDDAPQGFPGAKRGPRGGWYIQKKGKWHPILEGKEGSPNAPEPKPKKKGGPGRSPLPTAEEENMEIDAAGVPFTSGSSNRRSAMPSQSEMELGGKEGEVYRGKTQPPDYPDAQYDEKKKAWFYFDGQAERWRKVTI